MSIKSTKLIFDQICKVAARRLGASSTVLVDCNGKSSGYISGHSGCRIKDPEIDADTSIIELGTSTSVVFHLGDLNKQQWLETHGLKQLAMGASSLLVISVPSGQRERQRYLAVFNPKSKYESNIQASSLLSNLTSLAATIFDIEYERSKVVRALRTIAGKTSGPMARKQMSGAAKPVTKPRHRPLTQELSLRG